ncbi:hypothetical protein F4778DRAFT_763815 [Xylariomycetidae sp. FL2044]|nr:hypothetical protein F4778DRAFT_763815 [Xylariomycetidae sp. FL2044]
MSHYVTDEHDYISDAPVTSQSVDSSAYESTVSAHHESSEDEASEDEDEAPIGRSIGGETIPFNEMLPEIRSAIARSYTRIPDILHFRFIQIRARHEPNRIIIRYENGESNHSLTKVNRELRYETKFHSRGVCTPTEEEHEAEQARPSSGGDPASDTVPFRLLLAISDNTPFEGCIEVSPDIDIIFMDNFFIARNLFLHDIWPDQYPTEEPYWSDAILDSLTMSNLRRVRNIMFSLGQLLDSYVGWRSNGLPSFPDQYVLEDRNTARLQLGPVLHNHDQGGPKFLFILVGDWLPGGRYQDLRFLKYDKNNTNNPIPLQEGRTPVQIEDMAKLARNLSMHLRSFRTSGVALPFGIGSEWTQETLSYPAGTFEVPEIFFVKFK